jgi:succinylglutamate desuccinylase
MNGISDYREKGKTTLDLNILDHVPEAFLTTSVADLIHTLPQPTLFELPGRSEQPLFVSVLLHGNEDTGLHAIQEVLRRHQVHGLPRRLLLFVGNVEAAQAGVRTLDNQLDFNRAWPGTLHPEAAEAVLMQEVFDYVAARQPFASIDIHTNTGLNPHYGCLDSLESRFLHLARLFSRTVVFFEKPVGVQSAAMAHVCPAVTVECGKTGDPEATACAVEFIEACLALSHFPDHPPQASDFDLLRTFAVVKVPRGATFSFDGTVADIRFREDIDHLNFSELAPGTTLGALGPGTQYCLDLETDNHALDSDYFDYSGGEIRLRENAIPAMLTRDANAVRLDCLCYLMHRIDFKGNRFQDEQQQNG